MNFRSLAIATLLSPVMLPYAASQTAAPTPAATAPTAVPPLVPYSGQVDGHTGPFSVTFLIFNEETGGQPLFTETQSVATDASGHYKVHLGAANPNGLPADLFASGEARWLEVQIAGESPQPRVLLASVPYALKAADAATLGGLPASAFALAGTTRLTAAENLTPGVSPLGVATVTTSGGTSGYLSEFSAASTIADSPVFASGTNVGIGTTTPSATLDVAGTALIEGGMTVSGPSTFNNPFVLAPTGTATPTKLYPSTYIKFQTSVYNSTTKSVVQPRFQLQAEAQSNNTPTPTGTLNLLASSGSGAPIETGFHFNTDGTINFAPGQTFPGTGAITGVTAGAGLTGGGTSGNVTLKVDTTKVPLLSSTNAFTAGASFGGETFITGSSTDWMLPVTNTSTNGKGAILGQAAGGAIGVLGASPGGAGIKGISDTGFGVFAISNTTGTALSAVANGTGPAGSFTAASASSAVGVTNSSTGAALSATAATGYAGYFANNATFNPTVYATNSGNGNAGNFFNNSASRVTLAGTNSSTDAAAIGVYGTVANGKAVYGIAPSGIGVYGTTTGGVGAEGIAANGSGVYGGATTGTGINGVSNSGTGVIATSQSGYGLFVSSATGPGAAFIAHSGSTTGSFVNHAGAALWVDTGESNLTSADTLVSTTDDDFAGSFFNNSEIRTTIEAFNLSSNPADSLFNVISASTPRGTCGIGGAGNLTCTGQVKTLVASKDGSRMVETYAVHSPENWMEDFGSAEIKDGVAVVRIDSSFAETVSDSADYHIFLTPYGDSKGLYVTHKTATSFEVRESGGGTSSLSFDYRIVAKRRGFETQRLVDVTDKFHAETQAARSARIPAAAHQ